MVFLLHGEDPFRTRLRLGELAAALLGGAPTAPTDLRTMVEHDYPGLQTPGQAGSLKSGLNDVGSPHCNPPM